MQLPEYYEFYSHPKFNSGKRALETIPYELSTMDAVKPLVLADKRASRAGLGAKLAKAFYDSPVIIGALYDEVPDYASIGLIRDLALLFRERGCDSIIVIGSGPVMDIAKGVNVLVSVDGGDMLKFREIDSRLKPLIYVPTVTACGTETTASAEFDSRVVTSDRLYPDNIVIDPRMMTPEDPDAVINASLSVLTDAIEAASSSVRIPVSDAYSFAAIELVYGNLAKAVGKPGKAGPSLALANAAAMSGIALSNTEPGLVHRLARALSGLTGYPAGILMGILLPCALEERLKTREGVSEELLRSLAGMDVFAKTPVKERPRSAVDLVEQFIGEFRYHVPEKMGDLNIPGYRLVEAAEEVAEGERKFTVKASMKVLNRACAAPGGDE